MKGATPRGPTAVITNSASASTSPSGTGRSRASHDCSHSPAPRGHELEPEHQPRSPTRRAGVTSTVGSAQPFTNRPSSVTGRGDRVRPEEHPAEADEWNVDRPLRATPAPPCPSGTGSRPAARFAPHECARRRGSAPCRRPHSTNVHAAPCHSPPSDHREHEVHVGSPLASPVPAERDVQVVAEPAGERHVPPAPELLDRARRVRPVEVLRERGTRAAARPRSRCPCSR